ncbi:Mg2+ and Co2+ transporter CorA [Paenibacillus shirakamiensis]|uniref:Mg2+ and Co2+ transporter CorA n=1 Tax=Paenibacillus shirakamiensis TaxID=1265935 RepID=A0ABS4JMW3_9BACL|nr:magnesium transporter CorA family protein [Paenibacillus shirakamiensis]MBP2002465.1 Mg2+ and Co2+ transporter CorA [Paenibacillus shirakamiensis]
MMMEQIEDDIKHVPEMHKEWNADAGWAWHDLNVENWDNSDVEELREKYPLTEEWLKEIPAVETSYLSVRIPTEENPIIFGTLMYSVKQEIDTAASCNKFHFFISNDVFVTINLDDNTRELMTTPERLAILSACTHPSDALFILSRTVLHYFHAGMDHFEGNLRRVEETMKRRNKKNIMDWILTSRFELLFWHNLFMSFQELLTASREAYLDRINNSVYFQRYTYRVERMEQLFQHYEKEIDTLISIDDAISAFRGNEITKTLTLLASLFTPATVVGAIWGMNTDFLPWVKDGVWGFVIVMALIFAGTFTLWWFLRAKGWTGDLLEVENEKSNL